MAILFFALGFALRYAVEYAYDAGDVRAAPVRHRLDSVEAGVARIRREDAVLYERAHRLRLVVNEAGIIH